LRLAVKEMAFVSSIKVWGEGDTQFYARFDCRRFPEPVASRQVFLNNYY